MVKAQQVRDKRISDLVSTMEDTYSFVAFADELKANGVLQDIVEKILKQTIECGFFIQKYTEHNFGGSSHGSNKNIDLILHREDDHAASFGYR